MIIKRENWDGKYKVVARDDKGKILTRTKWTPKVPISFWKNRFSNTGSFKDNVFVKKLTNVTEITDFSKNPRIRKNLGKYQVVVEGYVKGKKVAARSSNRDTDANKKELILEAIESFWERVDQAITGGYEAINGLNFKKDVTGVRIGIVQYR